MSLKFLPFFLGMFLFMTYGVTHLHSPALINSACIAFADDDDEIDTPEEIADELDDVTEEENFLEDQEEAVDEHEEKVIEEVKKN